LEKFTESEYNNLADGLSLLARRGLLTLGEYHSQLIKLASNRASADNKPEVLISNVRYETYGSDTEVAHGYALNHPRLGETVVRTSLVISKAEDGSSFETLNTRYVIVPNPEGDESEVAVGSDVSVTAAVLNSKMPLSKIL
jgi:hypothetical protein